MKTMLFTLWRYRYFILGAIKNELLTRFARNRLGAIWMIIHPLAQVAIYTLVLSAVLSAKLPGINNQYAYAIYLMAGILSWSLFNEVLNRCLNVFLEHGNLLKKIAFPHLTLPLIVTGHALLNHALLFLATLAVLVILLHPPTLSLLWIPLMVLLNLGLALGLGLSFGILNVFIRDIGQIVPVILQFWFWLTPIVYTTSMLPESYRALFLLNPLSAIVMGYQDILVYGHRPELTQLIYPACLAALTLALALFLYRRASQEMVDIL
ncbi:MAG: ABC transporter permease [Gammaproteobacteria bacterium]|nr:ABC transporter permease [Gammaproteobacteria bacterium]